MEGEEGRPGGVVEEEGVRVTERGLRGVEGTRSLILVEVRPFGVISWIDAIALLFLEDLLKPYIHQFGPFHRCV